MSVFATHCPMHDHTETGFVAYTALGSTIPTTLALAVGVRILALIVEGR
jgi:hypothetical protein